MDRRMYHRWARKALDGLDFQEEEALRILSDADVELLPLLDAAFAVRKRFTGREVLVHVLNNVRNGACPEDCRYCAQSRDASTPITAYTEKSDEEILAEARRAWETGADRYCMVFAGRGPSASRVARLARLVREIKARHPMDVCVSPGILDREKAAVLKEAGLDRLNHNLNTSEAFYPRICSTHTYAQRLATLEAARSVGLEVCSGVIVGMGESPRDVWEVARTLRRVGARSIPVNFYLPVPGAPLTEETAAGRLDPQYCLRVLCLFRFLNPRSEIRIAAGREYHLRRMEVLALYPANSLFLDGYLNVKGGEREETLRMIRDAGFRIRAEEGGALPEPDRDPVTLKQGSDLRSCGVS